MPTSWARAKAVGVKLRERAGSGGLHLVSVEMECRGVVGTRGSGRQDGRTHGRMMRPVMSRMIWKRGKAAMRLRWIAFEAANRCSQATAPAAKSMG